MSDNRGEILQKIATFRFGVIAPLVGLRNNEKGAREKILQEITQKEWHIPNSQRSYICRSTVLNWVRLYKKGGEKLEALMPKKRFDEGSSRKIDEDTIFALINIKKEFKGLSLIGILKIAKKRGVLPVSVKISKTTLSRIFKKHFINNDSEAKEDMRRFEAELPNDMWQSDCMHGPFVIEDGKSKKTFLFAFIDDHSRLIPHGEFYLRENLENYMDCLKKALNKRGVPRKLYVDNGPSFRSYRLEHTTASLGIALSHTKPYRPEGKGKVERWFQTVRRQFLSILPSGINLVELNRHFTEWVDKEYHINKHSGIGEAPLTRFCRNSGLIRKAPSELNSYFRSKVTRKVGKDRVVYFNGKVYEAPVELIGKEISLLFDEQEENNKKIEVVYNQKSYGYLTVLDSHINYRIIRDNKVLVLKNSNNALIGSPKKTEEKSAIYTGGQLFENIQNEKSGVNTDEQ